jgi:hypothetical protein
MFSRSPTAIDEEAREGHPAWQSKEALVNGINGNISPPAALYVENYARRFGLPVELLQRWIHHASRELAAASLRPLREHYEGKVVRLNRWRHQLAEDAGAAARVRALGIRASCDDHWRLLDAAISARVPLAYKHRGYLPTPWRTPDEPMRIRAGE